MSLSMTAVFWLSSVPVKAQTFEITVQNQIALAGGVFQFDIVVQRTGSTSWRMDDATFQLTYNTSGFSTAAVTYVGSSTQLSGNYTISPDITVQRINVDIQSQHIYASATDISTTGTRIGTFRVTTISNPNVSANLQWRTPVSGPSAKQVMIQLLSNSNTKAITDSGTYVPPDNTPLPITLASFTARVLPNGNRVKLDWTTLTEINNYGFFVQRRRDSDSTFVDVPNSFIPGHGTTTEPHSYTFVDSTLTSTGRYHYRLKQIDLDATVHYSSSIIVDILLMSVIENAPHEFKLMQNYPNPFNPETKIKFSVENTAHTTMHVYNVIGQHVATLFDGIAEAGRYYTVRLDGSGLASGLYFYRLDSGKKSDLKKMMLIK
jgi:hypothetical protein